jgi:hypothetical protein
MARNIAPQDVTWFLDLNERGRLDLSPPYQRRSVWSNKERKYLLDTIFSGYPCPPIFLYKSISDQGVSTFHVVDGKQRLETVIKFVTNKISIPLEFSDHQLAGKKWKQLNTDQKKLFWNYQFAVEMLDVVDPATVKEIFGRYNHTSKNLEPQELRHAKYDGWFIATAEEEAKKIEWNKLGISTTAKARRMRDVQFISELMIAVLNSGKVIGFDQDVIEEFYANYEVPNEFDPDFSEEDFLTSFDRVKEVILQMEAHSSAITQHSKSYTHFYSLWCVVANPESNIQDVGSFADKYLSFMNRVNEFFKSDDQALSIMDDDNLPMKRAYTYAQNSRGANTEFPQRDQRNKMLLEELATSQV